MVAVSDEDGPYYWHIKSGTIQRDPPPPAPPDGPTLCTAATVRSISITSDSVSINRNIPVRARHVVKGFCGRKAP